MSIYSQSQYYQNNNMGGTVTVAPQQQGNVWNGSQWVQPQEEQQPQPVVLSNVEKYTSYYHKWTALHAKYQQHVASAVSPQQKQEMESSAQWAKYYADLSSQAAHYFYNNPNAVSPPFQLPADPPEESAAAVETSTVTTTPQSTNTHTAAAVVTAQKPSTGEDALKLYVDRCMVQCRTPEEKAEMTKLVELLIQKHLIDGTYHSTEWDRQELLKLKSSPQTNQAQQQQQQQSSNVGYYGPSSCTSVNSFQQQQPNGKNAQAKRKQFATNGHYGPSCEESVASSVSGASGSYYGSQAGSAHKSKKHKRHHHHNYASKNHSKPINNSDNYYGPAAAGNSHSPSLQQFPKRKNSYSSSSSSEADFVPLPNNNKNSKKDFPFKKKNTGFNQTDSALNNRAKRFAGPGGNADVSKSSKKSVSNFDRFMGKGTIGGDKITLDENDYENMRIKGTCEILEKDYLRLTAPPKAELVRPQPILEQHLKNLKEEWGRRGTSKCHDYLWFCSQLKAVRQDCTVQQIQNAFAVDVYETHARIALEEDDLNEYNQCQTQLKELYKSYMTNKESKEEKEKALLNQNEFLAYRMLYYVFILTGNRKSDSGGASGDLFKMMLSLTAEQRLDPAIAHALRVREACGSEDLFNYHLFFRLRKSCPNLGRYVLNRMVPAVRYKGLLRIVKGYRPGPVDVDFVLQELGFENEVENGREWLRSCGCVLSEDGAQLNTKDTNVHESVMEEKKSLI